MEQSNQRNPALIKKDAEDYLKKLDPYISSFKNDYSGIFNYLKKVEDAMRVEIEKAIHDRNRDKYMLLELILKDIFAKNRFYKTKLQETQSDTNSALKLSFNSTGLVASNESVVLGSRAKNETISLPSSIPSAKELAAGFKQIDLNIPKDEILKYFMILTKVKNPFNNEYYMTEKEVLLFLQKNFKAFGCEPSPGYANLNFTSQQQRRVSYFIYQFYLRYDKRKGRKAVYANLLKWNFEHFSGKTIFDIMSNMAKVPKPKNRIFIEQQIGFKIGEYFLKG